MGSPFTDALQLVLPPSFYLPLAFLLSSPVLLSCSAYERFNQFLSWVPVLSQMPQTSHLILLTFSTVTFCSLFILFSSAQLRIHQDIPLVSVFQGNPFTDTQKSFSCPFPFFFHFLAALAALYLTLVCK